MYPVKNAGRFIGLDDDTGSADLQSVAIGLDAGVFYQGEEDCFISREPAFFHFHIVGGVLQAEGQLVGDLPYFFIGRADDGEIIGQGQVTFSDLQGIGFGYDGGFPVRVAAACLLCLEDADEKNKAER